jgi:hypothetical protein
MIKNLGRRISTDPRKIKTGMKRPGTDLPMATDFFVIDKIPELVKMYGEKPQSLLVIMPSDNISEVFTARYVLYGGKTANKAGSVIRHCDGETCFHRIAENVGGEQFGQGEITGCICKSLQLAENENKDIRSKACKVECQLRAWVADPKTGKADLMSPFLFESHSINTAREISTALESVAGITSMLTGGAVKLHMQPFVLTVKMVDSPSDPRAKFPVWKMRSALNSVTQMRDKLVKLSHALGWDEEIKKNLLAGAQREIGGSAVAMLEGSAPPKVDIDELFPET